TRKRSAYWGGSRRMRAGGTASAVGDSTSLPPAQARVLERLTGAFQKSMRAANWIRRASRAAVDWPDFLLICFPGASDCADVLTDENCTELNALYSSARNVTR